MKIAFATTDGKQVDEHFGRAGRFAVYEISAESSRFLEIRTFADGIDQAVVDTKNAGAAHEAAVESKVEKLADCKLIYLTEIGGPSAARLVKRGIMPLKVKEPMPIESALRQLSETIANAPPPWLRKAMSTEGQEK